MINVGWEYGTAFQYSIPSLVNSEKCFTGQPQGMMGTGRRNLCERVRIMSSVFLARTFVFSAFDLLLTVFNVCVNRTNHKMLSHLVGQCDVNDMIS